jgi:hypothetical protein
MNIPTLSVPSYFREIGGNSDEVEIPISLHDTGNSIYERFRVKWMNTHFTHRNNTVEDCTIYFNNSDIISGEGKLKRNDQPIYLYINAMDPDEIMDGLFYVSFPDYGAPTPEQVQRMRLDAGINEATVHLSSSESSDSSSDTSSSLSITF